MKTNIKVSNSFVNSIISNNNHLTLKLLFFIVLNGNKGVSNKEITEINIDIRKVKSALGLDFKNLRQNLKQIQKTLITIRENRNIQDISLIPRIRYFYNIQTLNLVLFNDVLKELLELKNRFTIIDLNNLLNLQNKHSIRLITILEHINTYDEDYGKVKYFTKTELNELFNTNYKSIKEIERAIIKPIKEELDEYSKLTFLYNLEYDIDAPGVGRKPLVGIKIYLKDNKIRQLKLNI